MLVLLTVTRGQVTPNCHLPLSKIGSGSVMFRQILHRFNLKAKLLVQFDK